TGVGQYTHASELGSESQGDVAVFSVIVPIQEIDGFLDAERIRLNRVCVQPCECACAGKYRRKCKSGHGLSTEALNEPIGNDSRKGQGHECGPIGEALVGQNLPDAGAENDFGKWRRASEPDHRREPPAQEQRTQTAIGRSTPEDERNRKKQSSSRNDEKVHSLQRLKDVIGAALVINRSLLNRVVPQFYPVWVKNCEDAH